MLRCFKMSSNRVVLPGLGPSSNVIAYYGNGNNFQAVKPAGTLFPAHPADAVGSQQHDGRRRNRKPAPSGNGTGNPAARHTDRVADLTAGRSRQGSAERHEIGKGWLRKPLTAFHKFP